VPEQQEIDERHQGGALASGRDVAGAEVGNHRHAGLLGNHGRFADLQRIRAALVEDGLAMAADQLHRAETRDSIENGAGVELTQRKIESRDLRHEQVAAQGDAQDRRVRRGLEADGLDAAAADLDNGDVDTIERRAAHHARDSHM
jgi:hypothetical protein